HVMVAVRYEHVSEWGEYTWFIWTEVIRENQIQRRPRLWLVIVVPLGLVPAPARRHLIGGQSEQEEVHFSGLVDHLDRRPVTGADGESPVHHEFHVAGPARFVAGRRDLVRDVGRRNEPLSQRYAVVRQEHDLQPAARRRIGIYRAGHIIDQLDDQL